MKVLKLEADNFKNLKAVSIAPDGDVIVVGGENEQGKSSVMDAIWVAIKGRSAAPPKPIRKGEESCTISLDLGDLQVLRKFSAKEGGTYTDSVKVVNGNGLRYSQPQQVLDGLLGQIGFDPFEFTRMKPDKQADTLLQMVPLAVDLDELAEADQSDFANRRDVNRDAAGVKANLDAIPKRDVPAEAPDRDALVAKLTEAADTNSKIEREEFRRQQFAAGAVSRRESAERQEKDAGDLRAEAGRLLGSAENLEGLAKEQRERAAEIDKEAEAFPPLDERVDAEQVRQQLVEAEAVLAEIDRQQRREVLQARYDELVKKSEGYTAAMKDREKQRNDALASAQMPIEGLAFVIDEKGKPFVYLNDVPFEQASTAAKLKASTAIAMAANPELRVLRISDGSLLDANSMKLLREMAETDDFQLWIEVVGEPGNVGIIMENGEVRAAPASDTPPNDDPPEETRKQKANAKADKPAAGALL